MRYLLFILILCSQLQAQDKLEIESRVKADEVPPNAIQWLEAAFPKTRKLKWYYEETSGNKSYEAKFCYNRNRYSVEFSTNGVLQDVEIERKWKKLPRSIRHSLQDGFNEISSFKLQRIQEQWTGKPGAIQQHLQTPNPLAVTVRFEVKFLGEINGVNALWEGTFSKNGTLLNFRKIILPYSDNLDF